MAEAKRKGRKARSKKAGSARKKGGSEGLVSTRNVLIVVAFFIVGYFGYSYFLKDKGGAGNGEVTVYLVNDARCGKDCDLTSLVGQIRKVLPQLKVIEYDITSADGIRIADSAKVSLLPAVLFESSVKETRAYQSLGEYLDPAGEYLSLRIGGNWDPYCDPTQEHCLEERCKDRISCRPESPGRLDVFIMSQCPYGIAAMNSMKEVLKAFGGEINFTVNYIGDLDKVTGKPFSLHGQLEIDEDVRELCAARHYQANYLGYIWCRNANMSSAWEGCAKASGIDAAVIKACSEGQEGKAAIEGEFRKAMSLKIYRSPTFMINNKKLFSAVSAKEIQTGICETNTGFKGCRMNLTSQSGGLEGGSCA